MINYIRHENLFVPSEVKNAITIIGAGSVGSWTALGLAKMGLSNIEVYDFDNVEDHNIPNQLYTMRDVGRSKVSALKRHIKNLAEVDITVYNEKVDRSTILTSDIVMALTDTMKSREQILENCVCNPSVKWLIEQRMGLKDTRMYIVNLKDKEEVKRYRKTFTYSDNTENVEVSACGASQTALGTAMNLASQLVWGVTNIVRGAENPFLFMTNFEDFASYTQYRDGSDSNGVQAVVKGA